MKAIVLSASAVLSLGVGAANAHSLSHGATQQQGTQHNFLADSGG